MQLCFISLKKKVSILKTFKNYSLISKSRTSALLINGQQFWVILLLGNNFDLLVSHHTYSLPLN